MIEATIPLAVRVTKYQMAVRRCPACGKWTQADLPLGVPRRPFGSLLTVVATCRLQGRRLLDFLVSAGDALLQGTAAPSLLPAHQES